MSTRADPIYQEWFDKVAEHLLTQGRKSSEGLMCLYRSPNGFKCAVGCLIPDDRYSPDLEENYFDESPDVQRAVDPDREWTEDDVDFLNSLQCIHDKVFSGEWCEHLKLYAAERGLDWKFENFQPAPTGAPQ